MRSRPYRRQIVEALRSSLVAGNRPVLATVLRTQGSTPLEAGAKALIAQDGSLQAGTIGGGLLESEAQRRAVDVAANRRVEVFDFHLQGPGGDDAYPICGGEVRTLLQPVGKADAAAHLAALQAASDRRSGVLMTTIARDGGNVRWYPDEVCRAVEHGIDADGAREWLREPVVPLPLLIIVGAGHIGQALAAHAHLVGFELSVIDDRPELLAPDLFPPETQLRCGPIADAVGEIRGDAQTFIALVNRGHRADADALVACINKPCAYLGMVGSRRKARLMRSHFVREELATAEAFDRIRIPIGLDIGAETAPEIAAAIVAQLIAVRSQLPSMT
jgi:xanthine dehydrogenase accessory factor